MPYLLDTDVLVASKRIHYHPDFCQLFWDWVDTGHGSGQFFSLDKVKDELEGGKDDDLLKQWCKRPQLKSFFQSSKAHTSKWQQIANWASTRDPKFTPGALAKFLDVKSADAWLIAYAAANPGWIIVTNEVSAPESKKDIKLPDAATALGVKSVPLNRLLATHAKSNFTFGTYGPL